MIAQNKTRKDLDCRILFKRENLKEATEREDLAARKGNGSKKRSKDIEDIFFSCFIILLRVWSTPRS